MKDLLKQLKEIKYEAKDLINKVDNRINKTSINVDLSVSEIKEILELIEEGFRYNHRYDYYLESRTPIFNKLKNLID